MIRLAKAGTRVRTFRRRASALPLEPNPGYEAHILDRFPVLVRHGAARRADIRARVNAQIRDYNKTTDVRTADSRTGIAPPSPLARALLSRTPPRSLSLYSSLSHSRSPISPTALHSPFTSRRSDLSSLPFPRSTFSPFIPARERNEPPLPLKN